LSCCWSHKIVSFGNKRLYDSIEKPCGKGLILIKFLQHKNMTDYRRMRILKRTLYRLIWNFFRQKQSSSVWEFRQFNTGCDDVNGLRWGPDGQRGHRIQDKVDTFTIRFPSVANIRARFVLQKVQMIYVHHSYSSKGWTSLTISTRTTTFY
jgi:hypothetical protein